MLFLPGPLPPLGVGVGVGSGVSCLKSVEDSQIGSLAPLPYRQLIQWGTIISCR